MKTITIVLALLILAACAADTHEKGRGGGTAAKGRPATTMPVALY